MNIIQCTYSHNYLNYNQLIKRLYTWSSLWHHKLYFSIVITIKYWCQNYTYTIWYSQYLTTYSITCILPRVNNGVQMKDFNVVTEIEPMFCEV